MLVNVIICAPSDLDHYRQLCTAKIYRPLGSTFTLFNASIVRLRVIGVKMATLAWMSILLLLCAFLNQCECQFQGRYICLLVNLLRCDMLVK